MISKVNWRCNICFTEPTLARQLRVILRCELPNDEIVHFEPHFKLKYNVITSALFLGMLKYFRVSLPKRFMNKKQGHKLLSTAAGIKIKPGKVAIWEVRLVVILAPF